jgi:arylsulfatase A-like enzyme
VSAALRIGLALAAAALVAACLAPQASEPPRGRPNFVVIMADDLGYSDLGVYGSEIETPNLDALARSGLLATDFYVAPDGGPTSAMLLTGVDHHVAGMARIRRWVAPKTVGEPGYEERLGNNVVTLASLLRGAGYHTSMAGRWELGDAAGQRPPDRGFEHSFALHDGAASHWGDMKSAIPGRTRALYTRDGVEVEELPEDYYSTRSFTDFVLESIEADLPDGRPFFVYLCYQAPHSPLAAPAEWRDRYAGRYDAGYDAIRQARLLRMKRSGLVREDVRPYSGLPTIPSWADLPEPMQKTQARKMELYAAMVANLDHHVGRLVERLRELGELQHTLIVFLSDNGAEAADRGPLGMDSRNRSFYVEQFPAVDPGQWGGPGTFLEYGAAWAQVSMVPFRLFKGTQAEGGVRSPLILSGPGVSTRRGLAGLKKREPSDAMLHVTDLAPTLLELAGVEHPSTWQGHPVAPLEGRSLVALLAGKFRARNGPHDWLGFELGGQKAVRRGQWKILWMPAPFGVGDWRLYRVSLDPAELWDRSEARPEEKQELLALWDEYARSNGLAQASAPRPARAGAELAQKSSPSDR